MNVVIEQADKPNANNRVYPKHVLESADGLLSWAAGNVRKQNDVV